MLFALVFAVAVVASAASCVLRGRDVFRTSKQIGPAAQLQPTRRGSPFRVGFRYRVLSSPAQQASPGLSPGELLTYQGSGYSRYDSASIYVNGGFQTSNRED